VDYEQAVDLQCFNDLISIQALAAIWSGRPSPDIVGTLLEALVRILGLDFAYARVPDSLAASPIELVRVAQRRVLQVPAEQLGRDLRDRFGGDLLGMPLAVPNPLGEGTVHVAPFHFGVQEELGMALAASQRSDFPTQSEMLLLRIAGNQAAIGLQEARVLNAQRRAAEDLERRVAERTAQLTAANEELGREIAERKRAEAALTQAQADLARVMRVTILGELAASIAHEVNQPLAAVVANGSACRRWLAAVPPNTAEASDAADRIIRDATRASEVISRIRGFLMRGESHKTSLDVGEVIHEVGTMVQDKARTQVVDLRIEIGPDTPRVVADRIQLQQVILNLMMNAIEAMDKAPQPRVLRVAAGGHGTSAVRVAVCDSGVGIDPEQRERVFGAFFTTKTGGMGMGLAISRSIVEANQGRLWATKNDGPGETFQFILPAAAPSDA
jgi:C4-dicarboxylate-specific signal transduction histidine kinase